MCPAQNGWALKADHLARLLRVQTYGPLPVACGRQTWQDHSRGTAPVGLPIEKDAVRLQVRPWP